LKSKNERVRSNEVFVIKGHLVKVVRVERGLECDDREDEGREHGGRVQQLQLLLALAAEKSID
jgi:hypothetical protein